MEQKALETKDAKIVEEVVLHGDLAELNPANRVAYYSRVCDSLGLNPFTRPFEFIKLNNKLTLYARRDATDQLRKLHNVSIEIVSREITEGVYVVTARAKMGSRTDESIGAVDITSLKGDFRANAMMKAESKSKRRVTLSIVGLGWLDETEVSDISKTDVQVVEVDPSTGEITDSKPKPSLQPTRATRKPVEEKSSDNLPDADPDIDLTWVHESLEELQWSDVGKWIKNNLKITGSSVRDCIRQMSKEQKAILEKEIQDRLQMK